MSIYYSRIRRSQRPISTGDVKALLSKTALHEFPLHPQATLPYSDFESIRLDARWTEATLMHRQSATANTIIMLVL